MRGVFYKPLVSQATADLDFESLPVPPTGAYSIAMTCLALGLALWYWVACEIPKTNGCAMLPRVVGFIGVQLLALVGLLATGRTLRKRRNNLTARRGLWTFTSLLLAMSVGFAGFSYWPRTSTLMWAIKKGRSWQVELSLRCGVDPNQRSYKPRGWWNGGGWQEGPYPLTVAAEKGNLRIFDALLAHGASVELAGAPAICAAAGAGHLEIVRRLLDRGVSPASCPPLYEGDLCAIAAAVGRHKHEVLKLLLDRWEPLPVRGNALELAVYASDEPSVEMLLAHGAPIDVHVNRPTLCSVWR